MTCWGTYWSVIKWYNRRIFLASIQSLLNLTGSPSYFCGQFYLPLECLRQLIDLLFLLKGCSRGKAFCVKKLQCRTKIMKVIRPHTKSVRRIRVEKVIDILNQNSFETIEQIIKCRIVCSNCVDCFPGVFPHHPWYDKSRHSISPAALLQTLQFPVSYSLK